MSVFGQILPGHVVEDAVILVLRTWLPDYLGDIADQWDRPLMPNPKSYNVRPKGEKWNEDLLPAIIVASPGITGQPRMTGEGEYEADFVIGVVAFCQGNDEDSVRRNSQDYAAAIRTLLVQKRGLGGMCSNVTPTGEDYTPGPSDGRRSIGAAVVEFDFTIAAIMNRNKGPKTPGTAPGTAWGTVATTKLTVEKQED